MFALAACGKDETDGTDTDNPGTTVEKQKGLRLSEDNVTMTTGETGKRLKAYSLATGKEVITVTWESADEAVVQVNPYGELTATGVGSTTVRAVNISDQTEATCTVTVIARAEGITLDATEVTIMVAGEHQIQAQMNPSSLEGRFTYQSRDPGIASVTQEGKVTGLKSGTTQIIVTAVNSRYTATCTVKVRDYVTEVSMNDLKIFLSVGDTDKQVGYSIKPLGALPVDTKWTSSDPSVVSVSEDGKLTALKPGTVTVTVTMGNGTAQGVSASVTVEVSPEETATIELSQRTLNLEVNQTHRLSATVLPDNGVELVWSSSDPSVASVSGSGEIRALKAGKTVITVQTADGSATASCQVTVGSNVSISFEEPQITLSVGSSQKLTPIFTPEGYTESLTWSVSDLRILNVDQSGNVKAKAVGTATVTVTGKSSGMSASVKVTVEASVLDVKITAIHVKSEIVSVNVGEYAKVELELVPANANELVTYRIVTGNDKVRITENGIFAVGEGLATVTAVSVSGVESEVFVVHIQPMTNATKQRVMKEYNDLVLAEKAVHDKNLADINAKYDPRINSYLNLLKDSGLTSEDIYNEKKADYESQLAEQRVILAQAEETGDAEAAEAASQKIKELGKALSDLENDWAEAKGIVALLEPIQKSKQAEVDVETARHEGVINEINEKYDYLLPYLG